MLRRAHAETARVLVLTMDNAEAAEHVVRAVHSEIPQLPIIARARDADHASLLYSLGAQEVILETVEASLQLAGRTLQLVGTQEDIILRRIDTQRQIELETIHHS